jgi:hypothetical protein
MDLQEEINKLLCRVNMLEEQVHSLLSTNRSRAQEAYDLRQARIQEETQEPPADEETDNILIGTIKDVYFVKEYEYRDRVFEQFLLTLEDNKKYYVDKFKSSKPRMEDGHKISYEIDGNKLRNVRVLTEIKSINQNESRAERAAIAFKKRQEILNNQQVK